MHTGNRACLLIGAAALALAACAGPRTGAPPPQTVSRVDLQRYTGHWYEIAKIPNRFQHQCAGNTAADYRLRPDGRLDVVNRCLTHGGEEAVVRGIARVVDRASDAKLEVSFVSLFGWHLFWGNYWILDLGPDYRYAVVGTPGRRYGWILSRTPTLPAATRAAIAQRLRALGYDPARFQDTAQGLKP